MTSDGPPEWKDFLVAFRWVPYDRCTWGYHGVVTPITGWWFQRFFIFIYFHPYLGKISNLTNIFQLGGNHHLDNYMAIYYMSNWGYTKLIGVETPFITGGGPPSRDLIQPKRFLADRNMAKGKKATVSFFKDVLPRKKKTARGDTRWFCWGLFFWQNRWNW